MSILNAISDSLQTNKRFSILLLTAEIQLRLFAWETKNYGLFQALRGLVFRVRPKRLSSRRIKNRGETKVVSVDKIRFHRSPGYVAVIQRFKEGKAWEETLLPASSKLAILTRGYARKKEWKRWEDLEPELSKWDRLFEDIQLNGYREVSNNIKVTKGLEFVDGKHRLAMVHVLEIKRIPVTVVDLD